MGKYDDLDKLEDLKNRGIISEEEYQKEKDKILNGGFSNSLFGLKENEYTMLMHLSQFAGYILVGLGFVAPIILWIMNKENPLVDKHGKNIANFLVSWICYYIISGILCLLLIGIPMLIILGILQVIFVVMASVKAYNGEYWKYPMSINFFS